MKKTMIILAAALTLGSVPAGAKQIDLPSGTQVKKSDGVQLTQRWNSRNVSMPRGGRGDPRGGDRAPVTGGGY
jgi:hypothetical protein